MTLRPGSIKRAMRSLLRRLGYDIVAFDPDAVGACPLRDMARFLRSERPLILDVGANDGASVRQFREVFPRAAIHSFEPSPGTFERLKQAASRFEDVHLWNCALGSSRGRMTLLENSNSDMSSFLPPGEYAWGKIVKQTPVDVTTIDAFCREQGIARVDILKSDTQGFDLEVFRGAEDSMRANKIGLIYSEIILSDMYQSRPSLGALYDFLTARDFLLVAFYRMHYQRRRASWTDALFIHRSYL